MESTLSIIIKGREGMVRFGKKEVKIWLDKKPLLASIGRVIKDLSRVQAIQVDMHEATFSGTRQVVSMVNTLAWALGVKVNGKKQMTAKYSAEPHITMPK